MSSLQIKTFKVGMLETNCYLCWDAHSHQALVIDPGWTDSALFTTLANEKLHVTAIINTHGHADHIGGNAILKQKTGAGLWIHLADAYMLKNASANLSHSLGFPIISPSADDYLNEGQVFSLGENRLTVIETPGHSPGSISLLSQEILFSGDTLFAQSIGRTDLPGGNTETILQSIYTKLLILPDKIQVLPGHGAMTSIGLEKKSNPFLQHSQGARHVL